MEAEVITLNRYSGTYDKEDKYSVKVGDTIRCKNMTEEGARSFAAKLSGDARYVDKTAKRSTVSGKSIIDVAEPVTTRASGSGGESKKLDTDKYREAQNKKEKKKK